jgi:hypothetical protein
LLPGFKLDASPHLHGCRAAVWFNPAAIREARLGSNDDSSTGKEVVMPGNHGKVPAVSMKTRIGWIGTGVMGVSM